jgi:hypothetical protein
MSPAAIGRVIFSLILRRLEVAAMSSSAHDPVHIWRGVFAGQLGLFEGMRDSECVIVLLQMLGHVTLPKDDVEVA